MSFKSQFSMRFYELLSNQKTPLIYSIEQLKEMFCVADKYERINDFIRYVVDAAKKSLMKSAHIPLSTHHSKQDER